MPSAESAKILLDALKYSGINMVASLPDGAMVAVVNALEKSNDLIHVPLTREEEGAGVATLLPVLDPTLMGWKERGFYLDPEDVPYLFDSNGNGGTTAWLSGRVVGCWVQNTDGSVRVLPARPMTAAEGLLLNAEAERLTAFLNGVRITNVYSSLMMKGESLR